MGPGAECRGEWPGGRLRPATVLVALNTASARCTGATSNRYSAAALSVVEVVPAPCEPVLLGGIAVLLLLQAASVPATTMVRASTWSLFI